MPELVSEEDGQLLLWIYRLWVRLLLTETLDVATAAMYPRIQAASWGPTVTRHKEKDNTQVKSAGPGDVGRKVEGLNPKPSNDFLIEISVKYYMLKSLIN